MAREYILTHHAREQLTERSIGTKLLEETLLSPTQVRSNGAGKLLFKKLYRRRGKERLLLVVAVPDEEKLRIITVIDTSKVRKYLKEI